MDQQILGILKDGLGVEFIQSAVVGLRLSDRKENTIEVDFLIFMERRNSENTDWYKIWSPEKLGLELHHLFSEFRAGSGDIGLAPFVSSL
jgi:hypothetical protein